MKKLYEVPTNISYLWKRLQDNSLELLLNKAKELKKKYKWLQAAEFYKKAFESSLNYKNLLEAIVFQEKVGFCFYRAALQAKNNIEFRSILNRSILAFEKEARLLEEADRVEYQAEINHAHALLAYARSWYETDPRKIRMLLQVWWTLENQVLNAHEKSGKLYFVGKTCNDLAEYSSYDWFWLASDYLERKKMLIENVALAEKAIEIFSKTDDEYELTKAYISVCWYYGFSSWFEEDEAKFIQISRKCQDYAKRALELSKKIGDAWLISKAYHSAWTVAQMLRYDVSAAADFGEKMLEYSMISKDNYLLGFGNCLTSGSIQTLAVFLLEDPDGQRESFEKTGKMAKEAIQNFETINYIAGFFVSYPIYSRSLFLLASIETNLEKKRALLENAIQVNYEMTELLKNWKAFSGSPFETLSRSLLALSAIETATEEKIKLLNEAQSFALKHLAYLLEMMPAASLIQSNISAFISLTQKELAKIEPEVTKKVNLLKKSLVSIEKSLELVKKKQKLYTQSHWEVGSNFGRKYTALGGILRQLCSLEKGKKTLTAAIKAYKQASIYFKKADLPTYTAESYWNLAQLYDQNSKFLEASNAYSSASEAYSLASKKIPKLKMFYESHSFYMQAWSQIEKAKYAHSIEDYIKANQHYLKAANLHESTDQWYYLAANYSAWASMEEAESLSRQENTQQAKEAFQKALKQFAKAEDTIKQEIGEITSSEENELTLRLLKTSDFRRRFCQARIQIEEAKLLDRQGKYLQSSKSYLEATNKLDSIIKETESEAEQKELELLATLCRAWEKMAIAEETTFSESYLEAARFFEKAKKYCYTKKASLWTIGNSNFCKGLAAGAKYQGSMDLKENALAKSYLKSAASCYYQAGFKNASEYAKATQRLFDAYVFMNQAENEVNPESRSKQYQMAENLLQISEGSFAKANQPEKAAQVQQILKSVREEKALAVSLNEVMQAPTIVSTTSSFTAPSPTSEASVGLEQFQHANVQANLIAGLKEVKVGESFCLAIEFVNAGKESALLTRVEDFVPHDFIVVKKPEIYRLEESCLNMKGKQITPLNLVEAKVFLQPSKKGVYQLKPTVHYLDELGQNKSLQLKMVEVKVEEIVLSDRISTGTKELDSLLLGGIPNEFAVVLTGPPSDERELIVKNFLETGAGEGKTSFYVSTEAAGTTNLLKKQGFYLFLCNPKPKAKVPDLPNVYKLRGKTDLTNLNIALLKAYRNVKQSSRKRACINVVSDVLVDYGVKTTRKWIAELTTDLVSKGFTVLAVINPEMHAPEQTGAVLDLFDGEIELTQTDDPLDCRKSIRVKKLRNQDYIKNPICFV